jgi:alkanesulfonate monooxygenase SsuD/methylene tetrahydromethanopterin reductase-like flavin-dependent oxidoreductase (luciferase family)
VLSAEQFRVDELVEFGPAAEQAGFDAVWTSDHFQPWQDNQGMPARHGSRWPPLVNALSAS